MIPEANIDKAIERLVERTQATNEFFLQKIGESIKQIGQVTPSQARQLAQMLKYGDTYDEIAEELARLSDSNVQDIYDIYEQVAKNDYEFAKQFYDYRGVDYIPYEDNYLLQQQVNAIAAITANDYLNISKTQSLGYGIVDSITDRITYKAMQDTYYDLIDDAVMSVAQGKESFDSAMFRQLKTVGESGLRTIYESGRSMRLDSAIRTNMKEGLTSMHNELQEQFGKQFGADGVEISVHMNPAPDHAEAQGRQFSKDQYTQLQTTGNAKDYTGEDITIFGTLKSGAPTKSFRPLGMWNCYHYNFSIVLGVSEPEYSKEQLDEINEQNEQGFEFEGEHYTNYEGTQMQRQLERKIREQKDNQILAKASDNKDLLTSSQQKISELTDKYFEFSKVSGLPTKLDRMRVEGYKKEK